MRTRGLGGGRSDEWLLVQFLLLRNADAGAFRAPLRESDTV